jgi:hypothetical protein
MHRLMAAFVALAALGGCATPVSDHHASNVATCRRAADLGPGGLARLRADPDATPPALSARPPPMIWATLYQNCLRGRGIAVPSGTQAPVVLDRVGAGRSDRETEST